MTAPTPEAIAALEYELRHLPGMRAGFAAWILSRFVRREEHERELRGVAETCEGHRAEATRRREKAEAEAGDLDERLAERNTEIDRLRAELRQQRCDGSGYLRGVESQNVLMCPSCPTCTPDATPPNIGYRRCCGSDQDKSHEEWCDNKPDATPKGDECARCGHRRSRHGATRGYESACRSCYCERFDGGSSSTVSCKDDSGTTAEATQASSGGARSDTPQPSVAPVTGILDPAPGWRDRIKYICMYCLKDEHPHPCQAFFEATRREPRIPTGPVTIELGPTTLRALMAGIVAAGHANAPNPDHTADWTVGLTDTLLAKLEETQPCL